MENEKWLDNSIQFPRLLAEIAAVVEFDGDQTAALEESMSLSWLEIGEIFDRAVEEFENIKFGLMDEAQREIDAQGLEHFDPTENL